MAHAVIVNTYKTAEIVKKVQSVGSVPVAFHCDLLAFLQRRSASTSKSTLELDEWAARSLEAIIDGLKGKATHTRTVSSLQKRAAISSAKSPYSRDNSDALNA